MPQMHITVRVDVYENTYTFGVSPISRLWSPAIKNSSFVLLVLLESKHVQVQCTWELSRSSWYVANRISSIDDARYGHIVEVYDLLGVVRSELSLNLISC